MLSKSVFFSDREYVWSVIPPPPWCQSPRPTQYPPMMESVPLRNVPDTPVTWTVTQPNIEGCSCVPSVRCVQCACVWCMLPSVVHRSLTEFISQLWKILWVYQSPIFCYSTFLLAYSDIFDGCYLTVVVAKGTHCWYQGVIDLAISLVSRSIPKCFSKL